MTIPPADSGRRRTRRWLLAIPAALLLLWLGARLGGGRGDEAVVDTPGRTRLTHEVVVERVERVAKLVTGETTVRDVVVYENTRFGSTKRSLVVVTGKVLAGIDLDSAADVRIDHEARRIEVTLPPAKILAIEMTNMRTYDERAGLLNPFRPADRDQVLQRVRAQLARTGVELGVVEHANESAKALLEGMFAVDGYTVDVSFRGRAPVRLGG